jgi:hypothetical protein
MVGRAVCLVSLRSDAVTVVSGSSVPGGLLSPGGLNGIFDPNSDYLVDPASSHMLVSKIKPCMSKYNPFHGETAKGSLDRPLFLRSFAVTRITVVILELIRAVKLGSLARGVRALLLDQNRPEAPPSGRARKGCVSGGCGCCQL